MSQTVDDGSSNFNDLPNVQYENHFLMFKRAGNHAAYLQKVIDYADGSAVELACGTGTQALAVTPYVGLAVGVELDDGRVGLTYSRGRQMEADTTFVRADMFQTPFPDDAFSVAFNSGVFQHFDDEGIGAFLDEATRVASDYLVLSVANQWHVHHGRTTRRMLSHEYWVERFNVRSDLTLVEDGVYGNRLDTAFRSIRGLNPVWMTRWIAASVPHPRSWFVLAID